MRLGLQATPAMEKDAPAWLRDMVRRMQVAVDNGHLGFGDGTVRDNIFGAWSSYTTNAVANTEDAISHNLGVVPVGWLEFSRDKAGVMYKGATAWTSSLMYLKCNVASVAVVIFIVGPSNHLV